MQVRDFINWQFILDGLISRHFCNKNTWQHNSNEDLLNLCKHCLTEFTYDIMETFFWDTTDKEPMGLYCVCYLYIIRVVQSGANIHNTKKNIYSWTLISQTLISRIPYVEQFWRSQPPIFLVFLCSIYWIYGYLELFSWSHRVWDKVLLKLDHLVHYCMHSHI